MSKGPNWWLRTTHRKLLLGYLEIITGFGIASFWILFFFFGLRPETPPPCYFSFEYSFVVPDLLLGALLILGGSLCSTNKEAGRTISLPCGGGLIFLGVTDVSFNLTNGIYAYNISQTIQNAAINVWCIGFGLVLILVLSFQSTTGLPVSVDTIRES